MIGCLFATISANNIYARIAVILYLHKYAHTHTHSKRNVFLRAFQWQKMLKMDTLDCALTDTATVARAQKLGLCVCICVCVA